MELGWQRVQKDTRYRARVCAFLLMFASGVALCLSSVHESERLAIAAVLGLVVGVLFLATERATRRTWLLRTGVPARAEILAFRDTHTRVEDPVIEFELRISTGSQPPYPVTVRSAGVPPLELGKLAIGRVLGARVHLFDADDVYVYWDIEPPELPGGYRQ